MYFGEKIQITLASKGTLSLIINSENNNTEASPTKINHPETSVPDMKDDLIKITPVEETEDQDENFDQVDDLMNCELKSKQVCFLHFFKGTLHHTILHIVLHLP